MLCDFLCLVKGIREWGDIKEIRFMCKGVKDWGEKEVVVYDLIGCVKREISSNDCRVFGGC